MNMIKKIIFLGLIFTMAISFTACSDETEQAETKKESTGDHVWKTQTDALQSAKDMAKKMQESLDQQEEKLNENN